MFHDLRSNPWRARKPAVYLIVHRRIRAALLFVKSLLAGKTETKKDGIRLVQRTWWHSTYTDDSELPTLEPPTNKTVTFFVRIDYEEAIISMDHESTSINTIEESQVDENAIAQRSEPFVGRWQNLISTTNWEKGKIIFDWREALIESGAPATEYSDEAWARRVGGVTSPHVGRLRRVFETFHADHESY